MSTIPVFPPTPYALQRVIPDIPFAEAVTRTRAALAAEGFGVLTEIDMRATMLAKLGAEVRDYAVLGACNAPFALRALAEDPGFGLLLPCNVVVSANDSGGVVVAAIDPLLLFGLVNKPELRPLADEVRLRLDRALHALNGR